MGTLALAIMLVILVALLLRPQTWGMARRDSLDVQIMIDRALLLARERDRIFWARYPLRDPLTGRWHWIEWVIVTEVQIVNTFGGRWWRIIRVRRFDR